MRLGIRDGGIGKVGERGRFGRGRTVLHVLLAKSKRRRFGFDFGFGFDLHCDCGVSSWAYAFWPCRRSQGGVVYMGRRKLEMGIEDQKISFDLFDEEK